MHKIAFFRYMYFTEYLKTIAWKNLMPKLLGTLIRNRNVNNIHYSPKVNKYLHNIYNCYLALLSKYWLNTSVMLLRNLYYRLIVLEMFIYKKIPWKFRMHFYSKTVDLMYVIKNNMPIWTQTCIGLQGTFLHSLTAI